ncbi:MAG: choice-of-anchor Q domain-containing protein, partial [Patescibacteria group bacterium]
VLRSSLKTSIQLSDCPDVTIEGITFDSSDMTGNTVEFIGKSYPSGILTLKNNTFIVNSNNSYSRKLLNLEVDKLSLLDNKFYDNIQSLSSAYAISVFGEYLTVENNIFQLTNYTAVITSSDSTDNFQNGVIINNTFQNLSSTAIKKVIEYNFSATDGILSHLDIANNVLDGPITTGVYTDFFNDTVKDYLEFNIYNNVFYGVSDVYYERYGSHDDEIEDVNSIYADPLLKDTGHLIQNSPAIDTGADVFAFGVKNDIDGQKRPNNNYYDIGADEYY